MIDPAAIGETYISTCRTIFTVVEATGIGVVALIIEDNPAYTKYMHAGTCMNIIKGCAFWDDSVPFASLEEQDMV